MAVTAASAAPINAVIEPKSFVATTSASSGTNLGQTVARSPPNLPLGRINDIDLPVGSNTLYARRRSQRLDDLARGRS